MPTSLTLTLRTLALVSQLRNGNQPSISPSTYKEALPYVRDAFDRTMVELNIEFEKHSKDLARELLAITKELCDPDPELRGDTTLGTLHSQFSLERYVSRLNLLVYKVESGALKLNKTP